MTTPDNTPAFPGQWDHGGGQIESWTGMTLRDYFAAKASEEDIQYWQYGTLTREQARYRFADAMMEARK